jgi:hypothetical protein
MSYRLAAAAAILALCSCASVTYVSVPYQYTLQAPHKLDQSYTKYHVSVDCPDIACSEASLSLKIGDLQQATVDDDADIVVNATIADYSLSNVPPPPAPKPADKTGRAPRKVSCKVESPYEILVRDRRAGVSLVDRRSRFEQTVSAEVMPGMDATDALKSQAETERYSRATACLQRVHHDITHLVDSLFIDSHKKDSLDFPCGSDKVAGLSAICRKYLSGALSKGHKCDDLIREYAAIGCHGADSTGKPLRDENFAVAYSLACLYYVQGDFARCGQMIDTAAAIENSSRLDALRGKLGRAERR